MRILVISAVFPPEQVVSAQISKDLAEQLLSKGFKVSVIAPIPSRPNGFNFKEFNELGAALFYQQRLPGVEVIHLESIVCSKSIVLGRLMESWSFGNACSRFLCKNRSRFDIVYVNSWPIFSQFMITKECLKLNVPYITHIQDIYPESFANKIPQPFRNILKRVMVPMDKFHLTNAKKVVVVSDNMKAHFMKTRGLKIDDMVVIQNWQDDKEFVMGGAKASSSPFTFMYLGNIGPLAGIELLIKAFHKANLTNCKLVIAGAGTRKNYCVELSKKLETDNVFFLEVPEGKVSAIQHEADILLLPLIPGAATSSIPSKLPAYMFSKKPILALVDEYSDTYNAINAAKCGWIGPPGDIDWLSKKLKELTTVEPDVLREKGILGNAYAMRHFSKAGNVQKLMQVILQD